MNRIIRCCITRNPAYPALGAVNSSIMARRFHAGNYVLGLEEFLEVKTANDTSTNGRAWTPSDLRKKVSI